MKNLAFMVLIVTAAGSILFGINQMKEAEKLAVELDKLKVSISDCETKSSELAKLAQQAALDAQIQRALCEEQLKAMKK